jgi:hypothetical protein
MLSGMVPSPLVYLPKRRVDLNTLCDIHVLQGTHHSVQTFHRVLNVSRIRRRLIGLRQEGQTFNDALNRNNQGP